MRNVLKLRAKLLPMLLGLVVALGQAPFELWFIAVPAIAAALGWFATRTTDKSAGKAAFWFGFGYSLLAMAWIVEPFLVDAAQTAWMIPIAAGAMASGMGFFWGLGVRFGLWALGGTRQARLFGAAMGLCAAEIVRSYLFTGFPWALLGHIWIGTAPYQLAAWVGPLGVTLGTLLFAAGLAAIWAKSRIISGLVAFGAGLVVVLWPAAPLPNSGQSDRPVVRLVQPNAPQHQKWDPEYAEQFFQRQLAFTAAPSSADTEVDLVVWPEVAVTFRLEFDDAPFAVMADAAGGVPLIFGAQRVEDLRAFNAMAVLGQDGQIQDVYDKHHLVPFGEYIPGADLLPRLGLRGLAQQMPLGFSAGSGPRVVMVEGIGNILPVICYEAIFPHELRRVATRPDVLLHLTNDAWFGSFSGPFQHLAQARARAIEFGLPVVRVANTGVSAMIAPNGEVTASLSLNSAGFLDAPLPLARPATLYWQMGDKTALGLWIVILVFIRFGLFQNHVDASRRAR